MNIKNFLEQDIKQDNKINISDFIKDLENALKSFSNKNILEKGSNDLNINNYLEEHTKHLNNSNALDENATYVIRDITGKKISVVNIDNGNEAIAHLALSNNDIKKLNNNGIYKNIYRISENELSKLNLGSGIYIKNNSISLLEQEFKIENIKNSESLEKLEDMYFNLDQEKNAIYSVEKISANKIYLTNIKEGGFFSLPQKQYSDFQLNDLVKFENGKYIKI